MSISPLQPIRITTYPLVPISQTPRPMVSFGGGEIMFPEPPIFLRLLLQAVQRVEKCFDFWAKPDRIGFYRYHLGPLGIEAFQSQNDKFRLELPSALSIESAQNKLDALLWLHGLQLKSLASAELPDSDTLKRFYCEPLTGIGQERKRVELILTAGAVSLAR